MSRKLAKKKATKRTGSYLSKYEKPVVAFLVRRVPSWINPDHMTLFGITSAFIAGIFYYLTKYSPVFVLGASFFIFCQWVGDVLDGGLARYRKIEREKYGYYVDHITDMFAILFIFIGLGFSEYMNLAICLSILILFYLMAINTFLISYSRSIFMLSYEKIGPTELRVITIIFNFFAFAGKQRMSLFDISFTLFDVFGVLMILSMTRLLLMSIYKNVKYLYIKGE